VSVTFVIQEPIRHAISAITRRRSHVLPAHGNLHRAAAPYFRRMLHFPQHQPVTQPAQKPLHFGTHVGPFGQRGGFVVDARCVQRQRVVEDLPQRPAFHYPTPHVRARLERHRGLLPPLFQPHLANPSWITVSHVRPVFGEHAQIAQTIRPPARAGVDCPAHARAAVEGHQEACFLKGGEICAHDAPLIRVARHRALRPAHMPFAPPSD